MFSPQAQSPRCSLRKLSVISVSATNLCGSASRLSRSVAVSQQYRSSIAAVVEVVSSNWRNDCARKTEDYALLRIPEYWIVDYLELGGHDCIGESEQPTLTLCLLRGDRYRKQLLRSREAIASPTFRRLSTTAEEIFAAGS